MRSLKGFQKGVNLGGWLSQGPKDKEHLDTFIVEADIEKIASWGVDHVRLPLDYENVENEDGTEKESGYQYVDNCIAWCRKYNLNIVLDLHKTYGYSFDDLEYSSDFFDDKALQDRFIALWDRLSNRYAKDADIMMFELLNEVVRFDVIEQWNAIAARATETIRKNSKTAKILYGGVGYNAVTSIKYLLPTTDENIVYNFHCYEPMIFTHQTAHWMDQMPSDFHISYPGDFDEYMEKSKSIMGAMTGALADEGITLTSLGPEFFEVMFKDAIDVSVERDIPIYCGEYGVIDQANPEDTVKWFQDIHAAFEKFGIGRAAWSYKQMDFGLSDDHYKPVIDQLIQYL
ncbi:MAG: cellulase family glycosylhydrolase [Eubacteriales bacterium]|nr:cellulase family glycosylhydrolase [Eubacteriales bacterium]